MPGALQNHIHEACAPQAAPAGGIAADVTARLTTSDEPNPLDAMLPEAEFDGKLALVLAKPPACICATPRSQREARAMCR
jgi:hypothetical protein